MRIVFYIILAYILYQLIFKLIIPVYFASRRFKKGFREIQTRMEEHLRNQQAQASSSQSNSTPSPQKNPPRKDDYIDFEEIK